MANAYVDTTSWSSYVQTAYDKAIDWVLRDIPQMRQLVDKHPVDPSMNYQTITLSIQGDFASLATTPLVENVTNDSINLSNPTQVSVSLNEYGAWSQQSLKLVSTAFPTAPPVDMLLANALANHRVDTLDQLVRAVFDTSTNIVGKNSGVVLTTTNVTANTLQTDIFDRAVALVARARLLSNKVAPKIGDDFVCIVHPDVAYDFQKDTTLVGWAAPHTYNESAPENIFSGEIGRFMGIRFVVNNRVTTATDGNTSGKVYRSYMVGSQALVEANRIEPHTVLGPITDPLYRERPIGWYGLLGWALYRTQALRKILTASSLGALA